MAPLFSQSHLYQVSELSDLVEVHFRVIPEFDEFQYPREGQSGLLKDRTWFMPKALPEFSADETANAVKGHIYELRNFPDLNACLAVVSGKIRDLWPTLQEAQDAYDSAVAALAPREATSEAAKSPTAESVSAQRPLTIAEFFQAAMDAKKAHSRALSAIWAWYFVGLALLEIVDPPTQRLLDQITDLRRRNVDLASKHARELKTVTSRLGALEAKVAGAPSAPADPAPPRETTRRPPPPVFTGEKAATDATTWFGQFERYAKILHLKPEELVSHATLCLQGKGCERVGSLGEVPPRPKQRH
jgi:hypothetical protein